MYFFFLLGFFCLNEYSKKISQENCKKTEDSEKILNCSYVRTLSPQEEYDKYNSLAPKKNDSIFNSGYLMAINRCEDRARFGECILGNGQTYHNFLTNCAENSVEECVSVFLSNEKETNSFTKKEKIMLFNRVVKKELKNGYVSCPLDKSFENFYLGLNDNEKNLLDKDIMQSCEISYSFSPLYFIEKEKCQNSGECDFDFNKFKPYTDYLVNCAKNYSEDCVRVFLPNERKNNPFTVEERVFLFNGVVKKNILEDITNTCSVNLYFKNFYTGIDYKYKKLLDKDVIDLCNKNNKM